MKRISLHEHWRRLLVPKRAATLTPLHKRMACDVKRTRSKNRQPVLITMSETSRQLGVPLSEIRRMITTGKLHPIDGVGCRVRLFDAAEVIKHIE